MQTKFRSLLCGNIKNTRLFIFGLQICCISILISLFLPFSYGVTPEQKPQETTHIKKTSPEQKKLLSSALSALEAKNYQHAYNLALLPAQKGNDEAQIILAWLYEKGLFVKQNDQKARNWYQKALKNKNIDAYIGMARLALDERGGLSKSDVKTYLTKAAYLNSNQARKILADLYLKGNTVQPSHHLAAYWISEAAQNGDMQAQEQLGNFYLNGFGVPQNPLKAIQFYQQAADQGSVNAMYVTALLYAEGKETQTYALKKNEQKAFLYFKKAAEHNHPAAMADLGLMYYQARGASKSLPQAVSWFKKSAQAGDTEGCYLYAFLLARGEGIKQDFDQAYYWLSKAGKAENKAYHQERQKLRTILEKIIPPKRQKTIQKMIAKQSPYHAE